MGQAHSNNDGCTLTTEQLSHQLATKFSQLCFTPLELLCFRDVFKSLADHQGPIAYLKEDTIARFLEIPDVLGVSPVLFQMLSYLGAFPFGQEAPMVLGFEQMIIVVVILTQRYQKVLKKGCQGWLKLLFRGLAVYDKKANITLKDLEQYGEKGFVNSKSSATTTKDFDHAGFAIGQPVQSGQDDDEDDDDDLALAALEALDAIALFKLGEAPISQSSIPSDNFKKLIMLLLLIAPLESKQSLPDLIIQSEDPDAEQPRGDLDHLADQPLERIQKVADNILAAFVDVEKSPGVNFHLFNLVISTSLPFLFNGFNALSEHFLFSKNIDFTKSKDSTHRPLPRPLMQPSLSETGNLLDLTVLSQISFFLPSTSLFRRLRLLYSGSDAGFSMSSFESKVFNWRTPTIMLLSGTRISEPPAGGQEHTFTESLPAKHFPDSHPSTRLVFGVYLTEPWRQTHKECFGDSSTLLFQLSPVHEVFHASSNPEYIFLTKPPVAHPGIGIGCPHPKAKTAGLPSHVSLGPVSLLLDSSFEFGVFTHNYTTGGGAFKTSTSRRFDFQDRFEIQEMEVWGCGGDEEAQMQRERWAWEEREAESRRRINLGTVDKETDRSLLEMAGIIGGNRSGGSTN